LGREAKFRKGILTRRERNPLPPLTEQQKAERKGIVPRTKDGMKELMSGRSTRYRYPVNRKERQLWDRWWQYKGRGFTKPGKKLRNRDTKMQKESRKKNRRKK
jgi:hypothetical protein